MANLLGLFHVSVRTCLIENTLSLGLHDIDVIGILTRYAYVFAIIVCLVADGGRASLSLKLRSYWIAEDVERKTIDDKPCG